jgi:hypothetical protein
MWGAYPEHYQSTDKKGFYDPDSRPKKLRRIFFHCEEVNDWLREQDEDVRTGRRTKRG